MIAFNRAGKEERKDPQRQDKLNIAIPDAIRISHLASSAVNLALQAAKNSTSLETVPGLNASSVSTLLERWFGEDVLPVTPAGVANSEYLYGHYTRMHALLANSSLLYSCISPEATTEDGTPLCPPHVTAFVMDEHDLVAGTTWINTTFPGINFCPYLLRARNEIWQRAVDVWERVGRNHTWILGQSIPLIMLHEMSHQLHVGSSKLILDVPKLNEAYSLGYFK
ncbi:hypothetical protein LTR36_005710 [Oleoguttula mirabilis]|uniref:Uncharacterized protein n=1 Tax=Oleoguttula mirabilis TaxID=1507867 RepID=A0AAV9JEP1_9PEZI|nr:hypothetical protein LTR36_005710 [Oleoguttula mirabilis]